MKRDEFIIERLKEQTEELQTLGKNVLETLSMLHMDFKRYKRSHKWLVNNSERRFMILNHPTKLRTERIDELVGSIAELAVYLANKPAMELSIVRYQINGEGKAYDITESLALIQEAFDMVNIKVENHKAKNYRKKALADKDLQEAGFPQGRSNTPMKE